MFLQSRRGDIFLMKNEQYTQFNCYRVLGIAVNASPNDIKSAWRKESFRCHPDQGGSNEAQIRVNLAYEVLSDPVARQLHDIFWKSKSSHEKPRSKTEHQQNNSQYQEKPSQTYNTSKDSPLGTFKERVEWTIIERKSKIWQGLNKRTVDYEKDFFAEFTKKRTTTFYAAIAAIASFVFAIHYTLFWIIGLIAFANALSVFGGITIGQKKFPFFGHEIEKELKHHANYFASKQCSEEEKQLDRYTILFLKLYELLVRPSCFDDGEDQVARRLVACLFLMGYTPVSFDASDRTLLFADGDEKLIVRFRHRDGNANNITYVEKLKALMSMQNASHGLLFCSPGLSGNAAAYANRNNIKYYSLESMNKWIENTLASDYSGPQGDALQKMEDLQNFLSKISPQLSYNPYRRKGYRRRRRY